MLTLIKHLFSVVYSAMENVKGVKVFERDLHCEVSSSLRVVSVENTSMSIFVTKTKWVERYHHWFVKNKAHDVYSVYAHVPQSLPDNIRKVCAFELSLPRLAPWFVSEEKQMEAVVAAYVDILIERIRAAKY